MSLYLFIDIIEDVIIYIFVQFKIDHQSYVPPDPPHNQVYSIIIVSTHVVPLSTIKTL